MKLYCISGLGVDHRVFQNLKVEGLELVHIPWIDPHKNESLPAYAKRLFESANLPEEYNLIGVSFGGMIAQEFEKIRKPRKLFLVSTCSSSSDLTALFKLGGKLKLYKLIPALFVNRANFISHYLFGVKSKNDRRLFRAILRDSDVTFVQWAIGAIVNWKNNSTSAGSRLHGGKDKILPQRIESDFFLPNTGHFMIATHGKEVSEFISKQLH